jgi:hypothetical protein
MLHSKELYGTGRLLKKLLRLGCFVISGSIVVVADPLTYVLRNSCLKLAS